MLQQGLNGREWRGAEVSMLPPDLIPYAWGEISQLVRPAIEMSGGRHTPQTTYERLCQGYMTAFVGLINARPVMACICQVALYPAEKWLQVPFCGGSQMKQWLGQLVDVVDALAYDTQCVGVEISGRGGWERVLRPYGYVKGPCHLLQRRLAWHVSGEVGHG